MYINGDLINQLSVRWWTFLVRGVAALVFAVVAFAHPLMAAAVLAYLLAAYFLINGVGAFVAGVSFSGAGSWWTLMLMGLAQAFLGCIVLARPGAGALSLAYLFGVWAIMSGVMEIAGAISLRHYLHGEWWWLMLGLITVAFGFFVVANPTLGTFALVYTLGSYTLVSGMTLMTFGFRMKSMTAHVARRGSAEL